ELVPVRKGEHYISGGVSTKAKGETTLPGLYAVGETACVSINGANRLGSNSLSECLVFGAACGIAAAAFAKKKASYPRGAAAREALKKEEARVFDGLLGRERAQPHGLSAAGRCELPEAHARIPHGRTSADRLRARDGHEVGTGGEEVLMAASDVVFRVKRYRPESGGRPTFQEYTIPYRSDM